MDGTDFPFDASQRELALELYQLEKQHRELDSLVADLHGEAADMLRLQRLKREKLRLKDEISRLRNELYPNIIA